MDSSAQQSINEEEKEIPTRGYDWNYILGIALEHRGKLISANIVAIFAVMASVPLPLLFPMLVDEVLLKKPGKVVSIINSLFPSTWDGPVLYIGFILLVTVFLRVNDHFFFTFWAFSIHLFSFLIH